MVPMCCDKCKEKVEEELREVDGVATIRCDPPNSRVILTGDRSIDVDKCLSKAERAVKKKCELVSNQADDGRREKATTASGYLEAVEKSGILTPPPAVSRPSPTGGSRPKLGRMPSFASGKVTQYDAAMGPRGQDYEAKDYNNFRRMPSLGRHRHHDAEYITSFDQRAEPSDYGRREFAPIRRMPSFNRHRNHDAEYITTADADRDYAPRTFYEASNAGVSYTSAYNDRPALLSQVSFSKVPVENPNYVKHIAY
jgi:copper chaperone CopZ